MAQQTPSAGAPKIPPMPVLPGLTQEKWAALINKRPAEISRKEWSSFVLTSFEIGAERAIPSARLKTAAATAERAKVSPAFVKKIKDAELSSLALEATKTGRDQIASQAPLKFVQPGSAAPAAPATAVAAKRSDATKTSVASKAPSATTKSPAVAVAKAKAAAGAPGGEEAAYAKIVEAVHAGKGTQYGYGKLNFAYEIARRKNDEMNAAEIKGVMLRIRPLITVPGRYGISDAEYKNYAMVHKNHDAGEEVPATALAAAHKTALKLGHLATADEWLAQLPAAPARAKAPVATAKAPSKAPSRAAVAAKVAAPAAAAAATVAVAKGAAAAGDHRGVPAAIWKKLPPPPSAEISVPDWQTYAMVHYFVGTKHEVPTNDELWTASTVATKVGKKDRARIYRGLMSDSPAATKFDGLAAAKATKPASTFAATKITESIIVDASKSNDPKILRTAAGVAKEIGHQKTYAQLMAKADKLSPGGAPAAAPAAKVAVAKTSIPEGVSKREWNFFTTTIKRVNAKEAVPVEEIDHAKRIADQIGYKGTSVQLARAAADSRHQQAVAARTPGGAPKKPAATSKTPAVATAPAPAKDGGLPLAAKVAIPVAAATVATVATVEATKPASAPAPAPKPQVTTAAMVPPETVASVPVTPNKSTVVAAANATGVSPADVAGKILDAKNDKGDSRERMETATDFNRRLSSPDKPTVEVAREELKDLQQKKAGGDDEATKRLVELAAAAAAATAAATALTLAAKAHYEAKPASTSSEVATAAQAAKVAPVVAEKDGSRVLAPQASIAGPSSEGPGIGTVIAGVSLVGMGIFVLANKKKGAAAR